MILAGTEPGAAEPRRSGAHEPAAVTAPDEPADEPGDEPGAPPTDSLG